MSFLTAIIGGKWRKSWKEDPRGLLKGGTMEDFKKLLNPASLKSASHDLISNYLTIFLKKLRKHHFQPLLFLS